MPLIIKLQKFPKNKKIPKNHSITWAWTIIFFLFTKIECTMTLLFFCSLRLFVMRINPPTLKFDANTSGYASIVISFDAIVAISLWYICEYHGHLELELAHQISWGPLISFIGEGGSYLVPFNILKSYEKCKPKWWGLVYLKLSYYM